MGDWEATPRYGVGRQRCDAFRSRTGISVFLIPVPGLPSPGAEGSIILTRISE
jgi:hypothetical protein